jgi:hypothetical protein
MRRHPARMVVRAFYATSMKSLQLIGPARASAAIKKRWRTACLKAGLATKDQKTKRIKAQRIPHEFRRTAVRNPTPACPRRSRCR